MKREKMRLSDGRTLEYLTNGVQSTSAVILHAGTTQDIEGWASWLEKLAKKNVFAISFGRSGYAGSTKMPGRITIDVAHDVAQLAHSLGITKFVNAGLSGGGQHAIATGLDPRSAGVVTIGSLAPYAELGEDFFKGMQQVDIDEYQDALRDINDLVKRFQGWVGEGSAEALGGTELSDRDLLSHRSPTWKILTDSCSYTMSQGWDWVADDYSSYLMPWGFDPRDIRVPLIIWQGGLDKNVPVVHGEWLALHVPDATYELRPLESHIGIYINYEDEIIESAISLLNR